MDADDIWIVDDNERLQSASVNDDTQPIDDMGLVDEAKRVLDSLVRSVAGESNYDLNNSISPSPFDQYFVLSDDELEVTSNTRDLMMSPGQDVNKSDEDVDVQIDTLYQCVDGSGSLQQPTNPFNRSPYSLILRSSAALGQHQKPQAIPQTSAEDISANSDSSNLHTPSSIDFKQQEQPIVTTNTVLSSVGSGIDQQPDIVLEPPKQSVLTTCGVDVDGQGFINGVPTYDFDLNQINEEDKPWHQPGADITDYFNYGFNDETWTLYCLKQRRLRAENMQINVALQKTPLMNATGIISQVFKSGKLPPTLMTGGLRRPSGPTNIDVIGATDETSRRQGNPSVPSRSAESVGSYEPSQKPTNTLINQGGNGQLTYGVSLPQQHTAAQFLPTSGPAIAAALPAANAFLNQTPSNAAALQFQQQFAAALAAVRFPTSVPAATPSHNPMMMPACPNRFPIPQLATNGLPNQILQPRIPYREHFQRQSIRNPSWENQHDSFSVATESEVGDMRRGRGSVVRTNRSPSSSSSVRRPVGNRRFATDDRRRSPPSPYGSNTRGRGRYYSRFSHHNNSRRSPTARTSAGFASDRRHDRSPDGDSRTYRRHVSRQHSRGPTRSPHRRRRSSRRRDSSVESRGGSGGGGSRGPSQGKHSRRSHYRNRSDSHDRKSRSSRSQSKERAQSKSRSRRRKRGCTSPAPHKSRSISPEKVRRSRIRDSFSRSTSRSRVECNVSSKVSG